MGDEGTTFIKPDKYFWHMETLKNLLFYLFYLSQFYLDNLYLLFSDYMEIIYLDNYPGGNPKMYIFRFYH